MRLPFFRRNRKEAEVVPMFDPPSPVQEADSVKAVPEPRVPDPSPEVAERAVPFPLDIVYDNIPERLRGTGLAPDADTVMIDLPGVELLSQLGRGEVVFSLRSLLSLLPEGCLKQPLPKPLTDFVRLPLREVVSRIPADWLELRADQEILTAPAHLPELFSESPAAGIDACAAASDAGADGRTAVAVDEGPAVDESAEAGPAPPEPEDHAPERPALPKPLPPVAPDWAVPATAPAPVEGSVRIRLARLLDALPHGILAVDDPDAVEQAELEFPLADIVPQLVRGEIVVSLRDVVDALPPHLRGGEARDVPIQPVSLPLDLVVAQVPPSCFATTPGQVVVDLPGEHEIPVPFREAQAETAPAAAGKTVAAPSAAAAEGESEPGAAPPDAVEAEPSAALPAASDTAETPHVVEPPAPRKALEVPDLPPAPLDLSTWPREAGPPDTGRFIDGLDINRCSLDDLLDLPGIGPSLAQRIVQYREDHGAIGSLYQLLDVPGIGPRLFERITGLSATDAGTPVDADLARLLGLPPNRFPRLREVGAACERLPGVDAAAFASRDGLVITGRVGEGLDLDRVAACAPMLLRRISRYTREVGWGKVKAFSVLADPKSITVFATRQLMLLVAHEPGAVSAETIERLGNVAEAAERSCSRRLILEERRPWQ